MIGHQRTMSRAEELSAIGQWVAGDRSTAAPSTLRVPAGGGAGGDWPLARTPTPLPENGGQILDFPGSFDPLPDMRRWYVAQTETKREKMAAEDISRRTAGVDVWLPECLKQFSTRRRRVRGDPEPAFPGYFFVRADLQRTERRDIERCRGMICLVRGSGDQRLAVVRERQMSRIRAMFDADGGLLVIRLNVGRRVRIRDTHQLWGGWEGLYLAPLGGERVKILLDMMGRSVPVEIDGALVEAI